MSPKYFKSKELDRLRIPIAPQNTLEMHRNAKIDFYPKQIDEQIKKHLNFTTLNRYPDVDILYNKLSIFHNVLTDNLLLTSGIDGGIKTVFEMCTQKGSNILCLTPTYGMYYVYSDAYETNMIQVQSQKDTLLINLQELLDKIDNTIDIVFIPNPHVPVENIFELKHIEKIIQKAKQHDVLVFIDEAYYMFGAPTSINLIEKYDNLLVARTFSKGMGIPAIRLGYLLGNKKLIKYLESKRFAHETNSITIDIACWAIDNFNILQDYANRVCNTRDWLISDLKQHKFKVHGTKSNTILIGLKDYKQALDIGSKLREKNIWVRDKLPAPAQNYILVTMGEKSTVDIFYKEFLKLVGINV